jgi:hypothetical protein
MKTYSAPALATKGNVIDLTQVALKNSGDTIVPHTGFGSAPGNVGFQL